MKALQTILIIVVLGIGQMEMIVHADEFKLTADDAAAVDYFGHSVCISGDYAIIGAYLDNFDSKSDAGSAYIFKRDGSSWSQQDKLTASDAAEEDKFGYSVSISGDYAIVGAYEDDFDSKSNAGSAYIFKRDGSSWSQQDKLTASDAAEDDRFGCSVFISGDYAIVGAYGDDFDSKSNAGSAYIFKRDGSSWSQQDKLTASDAEANDLFGYSTSISGDYAIIGAYQDDFDSKADAGSAYIFVRSGSSWSQQDKLTASDAAEEDFFGWSVAISGNYAIVGVLKDDDAGTDAGSTYSFLRSGSSWSQKAKITASDEVGGDYFGYSVSINGDYALVGAPYNDISSGSAYIYHCINDLSLPVELSIFTATISGDNIILKWRTETEVNNIGFSIYRDEEPDGNYTKVIFVPGAGNSAMPIDYQFADKEAEGGKTYFYYLEDIDIAGERSKSQIIKVVVPPTKPVLPIPKAFRLLQNYPNPFNPETWLPYELSANVPVTIRIYNLKGQLVRQLEVGKQEAGSYLDKKKAAYWDGKNQFGQSVSSGLYFYTLKAGVFQATRKMVILR